MKGYIVDIEGDTLENENYRKIVYTAEHSQLVLMSIPAGEEIGEEIHAVDQFIRIESGEALAVLDGEQHNVSDGAAVLIPAGISHNIINTDEDHDLKLYSLYSPPEHRHGLVQKTKLESENEEEHFDGKTSE